MPEVKIGRVIGKSKFSDVSAKAPATISWDYETNYYHVCDVVGSEFEAITIDAPSNLSNDRTITNLVAAANQKQGNPEAFVRLVADFKFLATLKMIIEVGGYYLFTDCVELNNFANVIERIVNDAS